MVLIWNQLLNCGCKIVNGFGGAAKPVIVQPSASQPPAKKKDEPEVELKAWYLRKKEAVDNMPVTDDVKLESLAELERIFVHKLNEFLQR